MFTIFTTTTSPWGILLNNNTADSLLFLLNSQLQFFHQRLFLVGTLLHHIFSQSAAVYGTRKDGVPIAHIMRRIELEWNEGVSISSKRTVGASPHLGQLLLILHQGIGV